MEIVYNDPEYWCGNKGYRPPGYADFTINTLKAVLIASYKPVNVLDLGCAFGFVVGWLRMAGMEAYGADISSYAISKAIDAVKPYLTVCPSWDMPFPGKKFDLLFSSGMLEHIPEDKLGDSIKEMQRVAQRGIIGVACTDDESTKVNEDETHGLLHSRKEWQKMFNHNFAVISDSEFSWRLNTMIRVGKL